MSAPTRSSPGMLPARTLWSTFLRSFAIQGSWNYRTMLGQGFAFALLPVLQHVHAGDRERLLQAVRRHSDHFNAHPYLAELALGAVARMEADGVDPEMINRFKTAIRGPLGGLGDRLVWVGLLPASLLAALVTVAAGAPAWLPPILFLVVYNAGHLTVRVWAYRTGLREGPDVVDRMRKASLPRVADHLCGAGAFLVGLLAALVTIRGVGAEIGAEDGAVLLFAGGALIVGLRLGNEAWNMAALLTIALMAGVLVAGVVS